MVTIIHVNDMDALHDIRWCRKQQQHEADLFCVGGEGKKTVA